MKTERMSEQTFKIGDRVRVTDLDRAPFGGEIGHVLAVGDIVHVRMRDRFEVKYRESELSPAPVYPDEQTVVSAEGVPLKRNGISDFPAKFSADEQALRDALSGVLTEYDRNICQHENVKRGGTIWTICEDCDRKWADDRGGFSPYVDPPAVAAAREALRTHRTKLEPAPELLPCPFCGESPETGPDNPTLEGDAWGEVRCVNELCPAQPCVADGEDVNDDRGTAAYIAAAISRWNTRTPVAKPETTALVEPTHEAIIEIVGKHNVDWKPGAPAGSLLASQITQIVFECLRTFKPQAEKVEASDEAIREFLKPYTTNPFGYIVTMADKWLNMPESYFLSAIKAALTKFTPPKAGTLTDAEIGRMIDEQMLVTVYTTRLELAKFARAIEAKVRGTA